MLRPVGRPATLRYTRSVAVSQIKMPQLGESVTEGTVDKWLKHEGDFVKRDEPLVEVVTDKVNAEIPSPFEGKLVKIAVGEGETVRVGAVIAQIETGAPAASAGATVRPGARSRRRRPRGAREAERDSQVDRGTHGPQPGDLTSCVDAARDRHDEPGPVSRGGERKVQGTPRRRADLPPVCSPDRL